MAKEVKRMPRAITNPPSTAVIRVDLRRHRATTIVANSMDMDQLPAPSQPAEMEMEKGFIR